MDAAEQGFVGGVGHSVIFDTGRSRDDAHRSALFMKKMREIDRRRAAADHGHFTALELCDVTMLRTMRNKIRGEFREDVWRMGEPGDTDREHDIARLDAFASLQRQHETFAVGIEPRNVQLLKVGDVALLKPGGIAEERIQWDRQCLVGIRDALARAPGFECRMGRRCGKVGGEPVRFQDHVPGHVL
jgi:hypothetical protein